MSADAVDAVRRGFRIAFSRPSLPWMPRRRIGAPITAASGRLPSGKRIAIPTNVTAAPSPIKEPAFDWLPNSPYSSAATAAAVRMTPMISRRRSDPLALSADSRSAWTGATRAARRAGRIDDTTVTTVPTTNATTMVRGSSWSAVLGRSTPNADSSPFSPRAIAIPARRPSADAIKPVTNASTTTDVMTCRRLAPTARSSAISLVRCATMIENVLKMMNAPTNSAMNANTSSAVRKNPSASCNCFACSSATSDDLTASTPFGSADWMLDRRSGTDVAVVGDDVDLVELPVLVEHLLRGRRVERGERRTRQVVGLAEAQRAGDRELLRRSLEQDRDRVADGEVVLLGRRRVDGDLRGAGRRVALDGARAATWDCRSSSHRAWAARRRRWSRPSPDRSSVRIRSRSPPRPRRPARPRRWTGRSPGPGCVPHRRRRRVRTDSA